MSQPTSTRKSSTSAPDVITSPVAADILVAELEEHAERVEREAAESGTSRIAAARVRAIRRTARQIGDLHADA